MTVYTITNLVNGKKYVGQTTLKINERMDAHKQAAKTQNYPLYRAIRKYGLHQFVVECVASCEGQIELNEQEQAWIQKLNSVVPNGYNLMSGGQSSGRHSARTKDKMAASHRGKKFTEAHKQAMSLNHADISGPNHPMWGKHWSAEARTNMSKAQKGKSKSDITKQRIKDSWENRKNKARQLGVQPSNFKSPQIPTCHPNRKHKSKGLCARCYDHVRYFFRKSSEVESETRYK